MLSKNLPYVKKNIVVPQKKKKLNPSRKSIKKSGKILFLLLNIRPRNQRNTTCGRLTGMIASFTLINSESLSTLHTQFLLNPGKKYATSWFSES